MNRYLKDNRPLLALNVLLVAALVAVTWAPPADAQNAAPPREGRIRGDYTMVSGRVNAGGAADLRVRVRAAPEPIVVHEEVAPRMGEVPKEVDERLAGHGWIMM